MDLFVSLEDNSEEANFSGVGKTKYLFSDVEAMKQGLRLVA